MFSGRPSVSASVHLGMCPVIAITPERVEGFWSNVRQITL